MNRLLALTIPLLLACSHAFADGKSGGDAANGQKLYQSRCTACHSVEVSVVGPAHRGVFGRKAGSLEKFNYSAALKKLADKKVIWNEKTLDQWLADPEKFAPGQTMSLETKEPKDRADLIAYLKTLKAEKK